MTMIRRAAVASLALLLPLCSACGGGDAVSFEPPGPPVGEPQLPDIVPAAPQDAQLTRERGRWLIRFSTMLVNIGDGDFVLRANRGPNGWTVEQDVPYSESGGKVYRTPAALVWGGDGHDHWHVRRIAVGRLVPLAQGEKPPAAGQGWADTKIGFCYYDHSRLLDDAAQNAVYPRLGCGVKADSTLGMGLSPGWRDIYTFNLPGQSIDVTDIPDGKYRLWITVDDGRWFQEKRRDNNVTWSDVALRTTANGARAVRTIRVGPPIRIES